MSIFQEVKSRLTMQETAEQYGYSPNRGQFIRCPFHDEKTASMKLYTDSFHCFGCGKHGDIIDFVAQLKGLSKLDAAKELAADHGIALESTCRHSTRKKQSTRAELRQFYEAWELYAFRVLRDYRFMLLDFQRHFNPAAGRRRQDVSLCPSGGSPHPLFVKALHELPVVEECLRIFTSGTPEERHDFYLNQKEVITKYDREYRKYYGNRR